MTTSDPLDKAMLTLATASYAGWELGPLEPDKRGRLHRRIGALLNAQRAIAGSWQIVWGPESFNAADSGLDDAAVYVARDDSKPARFVIAVRGTNPVSPFDWLFGDFMVTRRVPWAYAEPAIVGDARLSFSTALGLSVIQHLRWQPPRDSPVTEFWRALAPTLTPLATATGFLHHLTHNLTRPLEEARNRLTGALAAAHHATRGTDPDSLEERIAAAERRMASEATRRALSAFNDTLQALDGTRLDPLQLILSGTNAQSVLASGVTLKDFLTATVAKAEDPVEVCVTGHSKGGALSLAVALWLADTQGSNVREEDIWDRDRKARVHAYAFAGPTAGNGAFARHAIAVMGARCHRTVNRLDVVPHAWNDLKQVPSLYDHLPGSQRALLETFMSELRATVDDLDYQHVGEANVLPGIPGPSAVPFPLQLAHQHLDGYFEQMDFPPDIRTPTFFNPLRAARASMPMN